MFKKNYLVSVTVFLLSLGAVSLFGQTVDNVYIENVRRQADAGNAEMCYQFAHFAKDRFQQSSKAQDLNEYTKYIFQSANANYPKGKLECAALVLNKDMQVHHPIALKWLQDLIIMSPTADFKRDDILHAHYLLGLCYEKGFGVRPDSMLAFKYYAIASITDIDARLALARFFYRGTLFQTNSDLGLFLIYSAYLQNHNIMDQIQDIFQNNAQVADLEQFMEKQASYGDPDAYYFLGSNMLEGKIFAYQKQLGMKYLKQAAELNCPEAFVMFGDIYRDGLFGQKKDLNTAMEYYERALYSPFTEKKAASILADYQEKNGDLEKAFELYAMVQNYDAMKNIADKMDPSPELESKKIYLKLKEYQKLQEIEGKNNPQEYQERLRMAANAGYCLAEIEYAKLNKDYARLITVLEQNPREEDSGWYYEVGSYYRMGGANNKLRNFEKSLKYLEKSASMGNLSALAFLTKTYKIGNKQMNILPDSAKYSKYAAMLAKSDIEVRRMEFFRDYLEDTLKKVRENKNLIDKKVVIEYMNPVYRSLPHSANVSFEMAKLYLNGCDDLQIAQDENAAFILFHLAVNKQLANDVFDYLESFFVQGRGKFIQDNDAVQRYRIVRKLF